MGSSENRNRRNDSLRKTQSADFGLLVVLDALLAEGSVAGAARRLGQSSPAVSRALGRARRVVGDPLLVRAGNRLVPTPRAVALRGPVRELVHRGVALLAPEGAPAPEHLARTYTIRASDGLVSAFGTELVIRARREAPGSVLRFVPEGEEDVEALRTGAVDVDIGVIGPTGPEVVTAHLFDDEFVGVVRAEHALARGRLTPQRFAKCAHISVSRRGAVRGPIDEALARLKLVRSVAVVVPTVFAALQMVTQTDLVAAVPRGLALRAENAASLHVFRLPVRTPTASIEVAWHPRVSNDATHRWLRELIRAVCRKPAE